MPISRGIGRWTWTVNQEEYLISAYGSVSLEAICKRLKKTKCSVKQKAKRLGLAIYKGRDGMSASELASSLGMDRKNVTNWLRSGDLKAKRWSHGQHAYYAITTENFWKFAFEHRFLINWTRYDRSLIPEPPWVAEEIARCAAVPQTFQKVTVSERKLVRSMRLRGSDWDDIAAIVGRSRSSVQHIFWRYAAKRDPPPPTLTDAIERTSRYG